MKRLLPTIAAAAAALAVAAPASFAREATTAPGYNFYITVKIGAKTNVLLSRSVARRGWRAHFVVVNRDKVAHRFEIGGLKTPLIAPGKKGRLGAQLETRGAYAYQVDGKLRGYFRVI